MLENMIYHAYQVMMTRKVAFGATFPIDVLAAVIWGVPLGLLAWGVCWWRRPKGKFYTHLLPVRSHIVWPPAPENGYTAPDDTASGRQLDRSDRGPG